MIKKLFIIVLICLSTCLVAEIRPHDKEDLANIQRVSEKQITAWFSCDTAEEVCRLLRISSVADFNSSFIGYSTLDEPAADTSYEIIVYSTYPRYIVYRYIEDEYILEIYRVW